jgi:hypothetical protein
MFKAASKVLVIAVMLIAFIGQAIAFNSAMSCETSESSFSSNLMKQVKLNESVSNATDNSEDCCGIKCCDLDCTCVANACSSFMNVDTEVEAIKATTLNEVVGLQQSDQPKSFSTLLYRPPIFIS